MSKIRHYENLHILLWLIKDICWLMEWKLLGVTMVVPTVSVALILTIKTFNEQLDDFWMNLAILFWICANAYWMLCEFFDHEELKDYAGLGFIAGLVSVIVFYWKRRNL